MALLVLLILSIFIIEVSYKNYVNPKKLELRDAKELSLRLDKCEVVVLGDSIQKSAYNIYNDNFCNFAVNGNTYEGMLLQLRYIIKNSDVLKVVLIPVDFNKLYERRSPFNDEDLWKFYGKYPNEVKDVFYDLFDSAGNIQDFYSAYKGSLNVTKSISGDYNHSKFIGGMITECDESQMNYLNEMLYLCDENNISCVKIREPINGKAKEFIKTCNNISVNIDFYDLYPQDIYYKDSAHFLPKYKDFRTEKLIKVI